MKNLSFFYFLSCMFLACTLPAKASSSPVSQTDSLVTDTLVTPQKKGKTQMPAFRQGNVNHWIQRVMIYPKQSRKNRVQGKVYVQFTVTKEGEISNPKVIKGINEELDREALRIISRMPKWKPGYQNGKPVNVNYTFPINFRLPQ